jgi:uncharacterized protein (DUF362 family)
MSRRENVDRRTFLKSAAAYGAVSAAGPTADLFARWSSAPSYFGLHSFIEKHPEAVFIRKTNVASKDDAEGKTREALALAKQIFALRRKPGIPLTNKFVFKPNLTSAKGTGLTHAIVTDPYVVEGFVEGLKLGKIAAENIYLREGLSASQAGTGYVELSRRSGAHYGDSVSREPTLKECPEGVVFRRTKYLGPFNYSDSTLINVSKFKTHSMGLTLCVKNLQGTNIPPYIRFCGGLQNVIAQDFQPDAQKHVDELYESHRRAGTPRWHTEKGAWMEMWIQRTLDHYALIKPTIGLNIIDGVYAQNGDGFDGGPGADGAPEIFPTNLLIFGKDAFRVDIIGHWLGGHEPGNFGLFHIGRERKVSTALNPRNIPVYLWEDKGPRLTPLESLTRTPLKTPYLPKSDEPRFHLCDEPFAYPQEKVSASLSGRETPGFEVLGSNQPVRGDASLVIEYNLPSDDYASLDLYSAAGERLAILAEGRQVKGVHMAAWDLRRSSPGDLYCRLRCNGFDQVRRLDLIG